MEQICGRPARRPPVLPDVDDTVDDEEPSIDGYDAPAPFAVAPVARNIDVSPVPDPVLPVARELTPLILLETVFMQIGFTEHGARQLCSIEGENMSLEALTYMDDKVVKTLCQTMRIEGENGCVDSCRDAFICCMLHGKSISTYKSYDDSG
jgi:hypothetical protein